MRAQPRYSSTNESGEHCLEVLRDVSHHVVKWGRRRPAGVDSSRRAQLPSRQTGGVDLVSGGVQQVKVPILDMENSEVVSHEVCVCFPPDDFVIWMPGDLLNVEDDFVLLLGVRGGVPLPAEDLHIIPRHLNRLSIGATLLIVTTETGAHVGTATVGNDVPLRGLADLGTVSTGHQDCGTRGSGEQGHGTEVGGLLADTSQ